MRIRFYVVKNTKAHARAQPSTQTNRKRRERRRKRKGRKKVIIAMFTAVKASIRF